MPTPVSPARLPDCVAFWDFQEASEAPRVSQSQIALEVRGQIERALGGVFGPYAARFTGQGHLVAPRKMAPQLAIGNLNSQVTIVAWLKREECRNWDGCELVAGV